MVVHGGLAVDVAELPLGADRQQLGVELEEPAVGGVDGVARARRRRAPPTSSRACSSRPGLVSEKPGELAVAVGGEPLGDQLVEDRLGVGLRRPRRPRPPPPPPRSPSGEGRA